MAKIYLENNGKQKYNESIFKKEKFEKNIIFFF